MKFAKSAPAFLTAALLLGLSAPSAADLRLASLFGDHMVHSKNMAI